VASYARKSIRPGGDLEIMMAPMIDMVFLLMVFFLCSSRFPEFEGKFDVQLPDAGQVRKDAPAVDIPDEVIVRVTRDGKLMVNESDKTEEELTGLLTLLAQLNPKQPVIIDGERDARHKHVVRVLNACYRASIANISFAALPQE
jgi:biopolymer transport protein ExbD